MDADLLKVSETAVRSLGYAPRQLQLKWRRDPPPLPADSDTEALGKWWYEVQHAIVDALIHEGVDAWLGDAVSCVAQIIFAYAKQLRDK
jgi:hypothetical protein